MAPRRKHSKGKIPTQAEKIVYARECVSRWWSVGSTDDDHVTASSLDSVNGNPPPVLESPPWLFLAEKIHPDLMSALKNLKNEMISKPGDYAPSLVIRIGKIMSQGDSSATLETLTITPRNELHRILHTNLPCELIEEITQEVVPKSGFHFHKEKDQYYVKVRDESHPMITITCKCTPAEEHDKLKVHKFYSHTVRHLVDDISCGNKNMDMRIMLCRKLKRNNDIEGKVKKIISKLVEEAICDESVEGGLKWPTGKESVDKKFLVVGTWHTKQRKFKLKNPNMSLYLRWADRSDYLASKKEISNEVTLKMDEMKGWLRENSFAEDSVSKTLQEAMKEAMKLTWENFLNFKHPLK